MTTKLSRPQAGGVARSGLLSAVCYAPASKPGYSDEIRFDGQWDGEGAGYFYLPLGAIDAFTDSGVVRYTGVGQDGRPAFAVVNPNQRLMIWREFVAGSNAKPTHVRAVDAQGNMVQLAACQRAVVQTAAPAAPPGPVAPPPAVPPGPPAVAPAPIAPPATPPPTETPTATDQDRKARERARWAELDERYAASVAIAAYRLREALGPDVDHATIQAGAATVIIRADQMGLCALPGLAKQLRERLNGKQTEAARDPGLTEQEARGTRAPANARRVPSGEDEYGDYPENLDEADDDLPF